jgi:predicted O-linked N-acetylglucosamine transferase (SPINDLY family)
VAQAFFHLGLGLRNLARTEEAIASYEKALAIQPDYAEAYNNRGAVLQEVCRYEEALVSYDRALAIEPSYSGALNNRGVALHELRRYDGALISFDKALAVDPAFAEALSNRGNALKERKDYEGALASYDKTLAIKADNAKACNNRGLILHALKRYEEALASYDKAMALTFENAEILNNRGNTLKELGRYNEALSSYDQAVAVAPAFAEALNNRGNTLRELKRNEEALANHDKALAVKPGFSMGLNDRALTLHQLKRYEAALASFDNALAIKPDRSLVLNNRGLTLLELRRYPEALDTYDKALSINSYNSTTLNNRAVVLHELKRHEEALADCDKAIAVKPDFALAMNNRGNVLKELKHYEDALTSYDKALAIKPDYVEALNNLAIALQELKCHEQAMMSLDRALTLEPNFAEGLNTRATLLYELGHYKEALASYDKALILKPDHRYAFGGRASCALRICDWAQTEEMLVELEAHIAEKKSIIQPFTLLGYSNSPSLQLQCAKQYFSDKIQLFPKPLWRDEVWYRDRIRIAYLSADFHSHATGFLTAELFELHDRSRFEVIGVSFGPDDGTDFRGRLVTAFDQFHDVRLKTDRAVAGLLRDLQVEIAVDLKGHTRNSRPGILAHRPAPVQVNYLGYPGTMGTDCIDYVIADKIVLPFEQQPFYIEKIVHLPDCYQVNDSKRKIATHTPTRRDAGLPETAFVFCCFNNNYKITAPIFHLWIRLLRGVEGSVLWLLRSNTAAENNLRREAVAHGIDPARIVFADKVPLDKHLARHRLAEIFLDTLPVNAHTTASDALWAGLPVVTCLGEAFAGRVAASLLHAIGLPELVTNNLEEYEALATKLASSASLARSVRDKLEQNRCDYPLFNTDQFRRHIEAAYVVMWDLWQNRKHPRSFSIEPSNEARLHCS